MSGADLAADLHSRSEGLDGGVKIDEVELLVKHHRLADMETRPHWPD